MKGILIRLAVIGVIAGGGLLLRDRLSGSAGDLRVGDCFDVPAAEVVSEVQHQPCTEAHDAEVFFVGDYPAADDAPPPTLADFETFVARSCTNPLISYIGGIEALETRRLDVEFMYPEPEGWESGDHEVVCYVIEVNRGKLSQSVRVAST